jgi:beta-lactam-binding protein with PASTA domain
MTAKKFMQFALVFMGVVALALISAVVTMKVVTWGKTVPVPNVTGRDLTTAITELNKYGLEIKVERQEHHPTVPAGFIINQEPQAGQSVKAGRNISVVVSLGSEEVNVPALAGESFRLAQVMLKQAGLTLGEVARVYSQVKREYVLTQNPPGQAVIQKGASVDLLVSNGPRPVKYVTPDLSGMTLAQVGDAVKTLALKVSASGSGVVLSQEPRAGYPAAEGTGLKLRLGRVTAPAPAPTSVPAPAKNDKGRT